MMFRRNWFRSIGACLVPILFSSAETKAQQVPPQQGHSINSAASPSTARPSVLLYDQLKNGLRATTPEQELFLQEVVAKVEQGILPQSMVNLVFRWARQRNPRVPFPYFQLAMRELSKRQGVILS